MLLDQIRERGPLTVAAFMDLVLYHDEFGYYARAARRSGRAGDFFTNVDTGPLFGRLLARQVAEMAGALPSATPFTIVEAGASDGRLARDLLGALAHEAPRVFARCSLHLVERSAAARAAQLGTLADAPSLPVTSNDCLPPSFEGVLVANELLDAMPAHVLEMHDDGLREVFVTAHGGRLALLHGPPSTPRLEAHLRRTGVPLPPGARVEVSLAALDWVADAVRRLQRGFMLLIDYGFGRREESGGRGWRSTLASVVRHHAAPFDAGDWLTCPGERDVTVDVDFGAVREAAESEGGVTLGLMDQTYFLMALAADLLDGFDARERLAFKTLVLPSGLGSTMKVLVVGKAVGRPPLVGTSMPSRFT